jgi:trehalose-6-phosphatase
VAAREIVNRLAQQVAVAIVSGQALADLRDRVELDGEDPLRVVDAGDDTTDEAAFDAFEENDLGVKVTAGARAARARLADTEQRRAFLAQLSDRLRDRAGDEP